MSDRVDTVSAEPQRLSPPVAPASGIRRILLATDLSAASEGAAIQAIELAHDLGAELLIVSVIDTPTIRPVGISSQRPDQVRASREAAAQALVTRGRAAGVRVTFLIWDGDPGQSIVDAAASEQVDLVVVGSHGRGAVGRFFVGSVSEYVVRNARCPVLVVRNHQVG
jgi:nucleotide-binding universal stress UspA family protein